MKFTDMLQMSVMNLFKRKVRTVLTVLGVVIGVASIVVMVSLGLGLNKSTMDQIKEYGSLTSVTVNVPDSNSTAKEQDKKFLDDKLIKSIEEIPHVKYAAPVLQVTALAKYGAYENYLTINATSIESIDDMGIEVGQGALPQKNAKDLELFFGNMVLGNFYNASNNKSYWDTNELPDIDLMNDTIFYILNTDAYQSSSGSSAMPGGVTTSGAVAGIGNSSNGDSSTSKPTKAPKKYLFKACGVAAGTMNDYKTYSNNVYCDIDKIIPIIKKEFKNSVIPGQPTTSSGKAYKTIYYTSLNVMVDDMDNVTQVSQAIKDMGYSTYTDADWIESEQKQMNTIQAVLGGIGAVSLLVAAIGITNTMMMSIYERTKEIGIMKVLGCDMHNIQTMFLMEAGFIGLFGGIIGMVLSFGMSAVINYFVSKSDMGMTQISIIPFWLVGLSILFAIFVGMVSGYFPSRRAMKLSPLAAIHNE